MKTSIVPASASSVLAVMVAFACGGPGASDAASGQGSDTAARAQSSDEPSVAASQEAVDTVRVSFETVEDIEAFFEEVDYAPQNWAEGVRELPRMFITEVGDRWKERTRNELTVQAKKRIFFRAIAPMALRSNELIMAERERLQALPSLAELTSDDREWLATKAEDYRLDPPSVETEESWAEYRQSLLERVDEVPVSLVLAQAADESGWGTSRFAAEGNALFGQWSFGGSGMLPEAQRKSLGNYGVAAFESPLLSVVAYMRNLNSHPSYAELRRLRAGARAAGEPPSGYELANGLERYSERGQEYVEELQQIMRVNRLMETDGTYLAPGPVYLVVAPED